VTKSGLVFFNILIIVVINYLTENMPIALLLFAVSAILSVQWLGIYREYKDAQQIYWEISKEKNKNLEELIFDIEFFGKATDYFKNTNKIKEDQRVMAVKINELECENLRMKIERIKENNNMTIGLIAIAFSVMALLVSLGDAATTVFPTSLVGLICASSIFFIIMQIEQHIVTDKRLRTKIFLYNLKQMERMWLEK